MALRHATFWCGEQMCEARSSADVVTRRYFDQGELTPASGAELYYSQDQLGSARDVTAVQNGSRVASFDYDPYGNSTNTAGRVSTDLRYAGMFYDQQDGIYLTQYRAYDPKTSRWLSRDPLGERRGVNLYGYALDTPLNLIDPLGLCPNRNQQTPCSANAGASGDQAQIDTMLNCDRAGQEFQRAWNQFILNLTQFFIPWVEGLGGGGLEGIHEGVAGAREGETISQRIWGGAKGAPDTADQYINNPVQDIYRSAKRVQNVPSSSDCSCHQ